jgi:NAD(P)-dependent dehydrogenase (short-subunit alcohol dehydrogenase family)
MASSKVWFITGASRGFGRVWTEAALKRGDRLSPRRETRGRSMNSSRLMGCGPGLAARRDGSRCRVRSGRPSAPTFRRLDVILSNAGYGYMGAIEELEPEQVKANFDTNVFGTLSVLQAALPILRAQASGHILTVSSIGGIIGFPTGGSYTASKFAIEAMSEALAGEVAAFGIKVTIIEPGHFTTEFRSAVQSPPAIDAYTIRYVRPFVRHSNPRILAIRLQPPQRSSKPWTPTSRHFAWCSVRRRSRSSRRSTRRG